MTTIAITSRRRNSAGDPVQDVLHVRYAVDDDADALLKLRNHYILQSNATFDECVLTRHDIAQWMGRFRTDGPYRLLVALRERQLVGYCSSALEAWFSSSWSIRRICLQAGTLHQLAVDAAHVLRAAEAIERYLSGRRPRARKPMMARPST